MQLILSGVKSKLFTFPLTSAHFSVSGSSVYDIVTLFFNAYPESRDILFFGFDLFYLLLIFSKKLIKKMKIS